MRQRIGTPIVPRNKADPTRSSRQVGRMYRDIEGRYLGIKRDLRALFDMQLTGSYVETNSEHSFMVCNNEDGPATIYQVNIGRYIYDMTASKLASLLESVQGILDRWLTEGGEQDIWSMEYVAAEYDRGTQQAVDNLSAQSPIYEQQVTLADRLSSPAIQNQIASAQVATYSDWKGISDAARADLAGVITDSVARGINPRETASIVSKRLDVSMVRAKAIAQTEQVGALRAAQRNETKWSRDTLGLNTAMLHLSALKPTSRSWHVSRHGKTYTPEEVEAWYAERGNRYNCYCSQIPCLLDDDGNLFNKGLAQKLEEERKRWVK